VLCVWIAKDDPAQQQHVVAQLQWPMSTDRCARTSGKLAGRQY
jgi:hypothetical protein